MLTTTGACALSRLDFHYKAMYTSFGLMNISTPHSRNLSAPVLGQVDIQKAPYTPFSQSLDAISRSLRTQVMFLGEDYQQTAALREEHTRPRRNFEWLIAKWFGHRQEIHIYRHHSQSTHKDAAS